MAFQVRSPGAPGPLSLKEVQELEQLTQQLMHDMEHPQRQNVAVNGELTGHLSGPPPHSPSEPADRLPARSFLPLTSVFSGLPESCGRCHQPLARTQPAVRALGQLFHITCFTCHQCGQQLQGQQFYSLEGAPYCEGCYTVSPGGGSARGWPWMWGRRAWGAGSRPTSSRHLLRTLWRSATRVGSPSLIAC